MLAVESFVQDLDREVSSADECAVGSNRMACAAAWFHLLCILEGNLASSAAFPIRGNFLSVLRRLVRALSLSDAQQRVVLSWGADSRAALCGKLATGFKTAARARDRDATLENTSAKMPRTK